MDPVVAHRSSWRWFPWALVASLGVVVVANAALGWAAFSSFPGKAVEDDFGASNGYDKVLAAARAQSALGWDLQARVEHGRPVLLLTDRDGRPRDGARIAASAGRPLGPPLSFEPGFVGEGAGVYRAEGSLPSAGNWDLMLRVDLDGKMLAATRRLLLR